MKKYRAAVIGTGSMGAFIDNKVVGYHSAYYPYSHAACFEHCQRTALVAGCVLREDVLERFGERYESQARIFTPTTER